jgi:aminoglycoside 6'-N-acetyltransferase I
VIQIREVQAQDRDEWLRLLLDLHPASEASDHSAIVDAYFASSGSQWLIPSVVFVAERSEFALCGLLELSVRNYAEGCTGATPYVEAWYVDPDSRRIGIGRKLMTAAERWALANGYFELASDAKLSNTLSHRAHASLGFSVAERVVVFRKQLQDPN